MRTLVKSKQINEQIKNKFKTVQGESKEQTHIQAIKNAEVN